MNKLTQTILTLSFSVITCVALAQEPCKGTLFSIGDENVGCQEFLDTYIKNSPPGKKIDYSESALRDYLNLYINFRLKVKEAKELKIDTMSTVKSELNTYRSQLAKSYLTDTSTIGALTREAYERMKDERHIMHILVKCDPNASASDTMKAYNKIKKIYALLLKNKDFGQVAKDSSEDKSSSPDGGDLGYITSMQVDYKFENAAYNTPSGKFSAPFRTRYGYHIVKVVDVRPNPGTVQVAHILIKVPKNATDADKEKAKAKIDEVYSKLKEGEIFEDLVKEFSEDKTSVNDGGKLAPFGPGKMLGEFEDAAFGLKNVGDYSQPVQTKVGWHIIKLLDKKPLPSYGETKDALKKQVEKDQRSEEAQSNFIAKLKKEYNLQENAGAKAELLSKTDSGLVKGLWTAESAKGLNGTLFTLSDNVNTHNSKQYSQKDFADFIEKNEHKFMNRGDKELMFNKMYNQYLENSIMSFEEERLAAKHPAFRNLMGEYSDGILLFELTDQKVWTKAVKDSTGLKAFYQTDSKNYMGNEKAKVTSYTCANQAVADEVTKLIEKGTADDKILSKINKKNAGDVKIDYSTAEKGKNSEVETLGWEKGKSYSAKTDKGGIKILRITDIMAPAPKALEEVRGYIVADYQEKLEKEWIQKLREKYPVKINDGVLMSLVK